MRCINAALVLALALSCVACGDSSEPQLLSVTTLTDSSSTIGPYEVLVSVTDDGAVEDVELRYQVGTDDMTVVPMEHLGGIVWVGHIPGQPLGSIIHYQVVARDDEDQEAGFPPEEPFVHTFQIVERADGP